jgi:hypothetical protein
MIRFFIALFFLVSAAAFGSEVLLKERVMKAKSGDYLVAESNQSITLLCIRSIAPKSLVLEEITAPAKQLKERPASWADWIRNKAPGHSSWSMLEIDLESGEITECYSFSRNAWVQLSPGESLFATLLQVPLKPIPERERRRIGPPPEAGESDFRKIWQPPLVFEGKKREQAKFDAFLADWPQDGTELAGKTVTLYLDRDVQFPLPLWISVESTHAIGNFRAIDSGRNLPSVYRSLPRRVPQFVGVPQKTEKGLSLTLKSPKYFREFELFAIDVTKREKQIFPIAHSLAKGEGGLLTIEIDQDELRQVLEDDHRYTWLLVPAGHSDSYTETTKPFIWKSE